MQKIINMTPHKIVIIKDYEKIKLESAGTIRLKSNTTYIGELITDKGKIPVTHSILETEVDVPERKQGTIYIVSNLVCQAYPKRDDFYIVNETIRDNQGRIVGCKSISQNPYYKK